jgi:predicted  nucleic acid-binding Zn-ribbon protein
VSDNHVNFLSQSNSRSNSPTIKIRFKNNKRPIDHLNASTETYCEIKSRKVDSIAPIIFFGLESKFIKDQCLLEKEIIKASLQINCKIKEIKVTANGNLLVHFPSAEDKVKFVSQNDFLPNLRKLDLETSDSKKFVAIVKGINASDLESKLSFFKDTKLNIKNIIEIKNHEGRILKMCKLEFDNKDERDNIINIGSIQIGLTRYRIESIAKSPIRCNNCKQFGHTTINCKSNEKCAKCGEEHNTGVCKSLLSKCSNCGENHSSYYKGCKMYKSLLRIEIAKSKSEHTGSNLLRNKINPSGPSDGFVRTYSSTVKSTMEDNLSIEKHFLKLTDHIDNKFNLLTNSLELKVNEKFEQIINTVEEKTSKLIFQNNTRLCHFLLDIIKLLVPNTLKPDKKVIETLNNRLNFHKMGSISTINLTEYADKLWLNAAQILK